MLACFFPHNQARRAKKTILNKKAENYSADNLRSWLIDRDQEDNVLLSRIRWSVANSRGVLQHLCLALIRFKVLLIRARKSISLRQGSDTCANPTNVDYSNLASNRDLTITEETREDAIVHGIKRLNQRLAFRKLRAVETKDDGNCQFRALSSELFGNPEYHLQVRAAAVAYLEKHRSRFIYFAEGEQSWDSYLANMARPGTWGDELTLQAVCESFGVAIHVLTTEERNYYLRYDPPGSGRSMRHAFLAYISPVHYTSVAAAEQC